MQLGDGLNAKADQEQFVVLHPNGLPLPNTERGWDIAGTQVNQATFVKALLDELGHRVCIDPSRVYATGISNGAEMAVAAACALPKRIAAYASVADGRAVQCPNGKPTPALAFHGLNDIIYPYKGWPEKQVLPAEKLMNRQAKRNGCTGGPKIQRISANVQKLSWTGCKAPAVLYRLNNHGHAWPGVPVPFARSDVVAAFAPGGALNPTAVAFGFTPEQLADNGMLTNTEINATDVMWQFFTTARRP
jgi:poly(3-hydroxybutyrate) depolymerase